MSGIPSFEQIDEQRAKAGITRRALYEEADVHKETWRRISLNKVQPNTATLKKLDDALFRLRERKGEA